MTGGKRDGGAAWPITLAAGLVLLAAAAFFLWWLNLGDGRTSVYEIEGQPPDHHAPVYPVELYEGQEVSLWAIGRDHEADGYLDALFKRPCALTGPPGTEAAGFRPMVSGDQVVGYFTAPADGVYEFRCGGYRIGQGPAEPGVLGQALGTGAAIVVGLLALLLILAAIGQRPGGRR